MNTPQEPFTVVPYDARFKALSPLTVAHTEDGPDAVWEAARVALPPSARSFALYDRNGDLVRVGVLPVDSLTDDPDVTSMAFDATGARVATGHADGNLRVWNVVTGDPIWTRTPADEPILGVAFVDRGPWLLAWCDDGPLLVFERDSGELINRIEDPQVGAFTAVPAPDGSEVAMTGLRVIRIALPGGELRAALDGERATQASVEMRSDRTAPLDEGVLWLAYAPDGQSIVGVRAGEPSDELVFWDRASGQRIGALTLSDGVCACDLSPDGKIAALAVTSEPVTVLLVDTATRAIAHSISIGGEGVHDLRFTADGATLLVHDAGRGILLLDVASRAITGTMPEFEGTDGLLPREDTIVPDEAESRPMMVTRDPDGRLELTALESRGIFGPLGRTVSSDGTRFAVVPYATDNNFVTVFDLNRRTAVATLPHRGNVQEIWLSSDGSRIAVRAVGEVTSWTVPPAPARWAPVR